MYVFINVKHDYMSEEIIRKQIINSIHLSGNRGEKNINHKQPR